MKVAYLLGSLNCGGAEMLLLDVFKNASLVPFDFIGIHRKGGVLQEEFENAKVPFILCPSQRNTIRYIIHLRRFFKQEHITIVHTQFPIDCILVRLATIGTDIHVVTTFHGFNFSKNLFIKLRNYFAIEWAHKVCFVSQYQRNVYEKLYTNISDKSSLVYNGINFSKLDLTNMASSERIIDESKINLCMIGSFGSTRSQWVICEAIQQLIKRKHHRLDSFVFYFIGAKRETEPNLYDCCVTYCKQHHLDNVHFLGVRNDVPSLLHQMDGVVYSSAHDTFGIAVVEAMAAGLPVIVNDWDVMKEITHNGKWATLFRTEDVEDCANKIQDLIEHLSERKEIAKQVAKEVREEYSIEKHIARLNEVYEDVMKK